AASSHTGSMAGRDDVFDAACRQTGVIRAAGLEEMLDLCIGFEHYAVPRGKKLLIVTNSGGPGILTSDHAEEEGLELPAPSGTLKSSLKDFLLPNASLNNPIDLTVEGTDKDYTLAISRGLDTEYDAAIAINVGTPFLDSLGLAEGIIQGASLVPDKPVIPIFMSGKVVKNGADLLSASGMPPLPTGERAAAVLSAMADWHSGKERVRKQWALLSENSISKRKSFLEPDQVEFLIEQGFSYRAHRFVTSKAEILKVSEIIPFPMVMKVVSPNIIHKSEFGGVVLNINNDEELLSAYRDMNNRLSAHEIKGVMVYEQVPEGTEIILGAKKDPDFGPVILVGAGGIMSEVMKDVSLRIAPVTERECAEMLGELKYDRIISGFRGKPPLARDALIDLIMKLSGLMTTEPWIEELDFNPVFLYEDRAVIGDVRIIDTSDKHTPFCSSVI
ncbi:MAG: acetate--CoA ligase family protein, partial [Spirochaetales bacterium]|nr:acetate--CoA ligase family protein [Spirochaetales bacterium]